MSQDQVESKRTQADLLPGGIPSSLLSSSSSNQTTNLSASQQGLLEMYRKMQPSSTASSTGQFLPLPQDIIALLPTPPFSQLEAFHNYGGPNVKDDNVLTRILTCQFMNEYLDRCDLMLGQAEANLRTTAQAIEGIHSFLKQAVGDAQGS